MARVIIRNKALKLRQKGKSINEISLELKIPKSTVSVWCRNIRLTPMQIRRLADKQESGSYKGRMKFLERIREKRISQIKKLREKGLREVGTIDKRDLFIAGTAIYWSEGVTAPTGDEASFSNSDPRMVLFMMNWFKSVCGISNDQFAIQIRINIIYKDNIREIENFWSETLKIPLEQFTKTIIIKTKLKKVYPDCNNYYGTIRVKIRRGTLLRRRIDGWIDGLIRKTKK